MARNRHERGACILGQEQGIVLFRDNYETVRQILSLEQKGVLLDSVFDGAYVGTDPLVQMAFNLFQAAIVRSARKYEAACEKNRENAIRRWKREKENAEKAAAYDRMQLDASASDGMRLNATGAGADTGADTGAVTFSVSRKTRFVPPQVEDVAAYCRERGNKVDPDQFVDFYSARGWQLKQGVHMRDWKAAVRTWERHQGRGGVNGASGGVHPTDRIQGQRDLYAL